MSRVELNLTEELLLQHLLRLGDKAMLVGARVEQRGRMRMVVLDVHMPEAPDGADEAVPNYRRVSDAPDPVELTGITWFRDGRPIAIDQPPEVSPP